MYLDIFLLTLLIAAAVWAIMHGTLLRAAIWLAITSVVLTVIMFKLGATLAAVFELSVCAGLIPVIFMSTISLTKPQTHEETMDMTKGRISRFWPLPVILVLIGSALIFTNLPLGFTLPAPSTYTNVRSFLWELRQLDMLGQILILLAGVFGIVVLFKNTPKDSAE